MRWILVQLSSHFQQSSLNKGSITLINQSDTAAMASNQPKSDKLTMNPHLKRTSLLLTIFAIYFVGFKDTKLLNKLPIDFAEKKQTKSAENTELRDVNRANSVTTTSSEPYKNRWQRRFSNNTQSYFFFKHIRKAGGTTLRSYFRDVFSYHGIRHTTRDDYSKIKMGNASPDVLYVEHEFQTMDSECARVDRRWDKSLRVITLRHPIERHMSEFFFSGPGTKFHIDRTQLYTNETYTQELSAFLTENIPEWMGQEGGGKNSIRKFGPLEGRFNMYFGRFYTNNFQLRALAGCSNDGCMAKRLGNTAVPVQIQTLHPTGNATLYQTPNPTCTQYFHKLNVLFDPCAKSACKQEVCALGCDGPCFYPSVAWGSLDQSDVERAINALKDFDLILLMERFDDLDQAALMADVLGVPRDAEFALSKHNASYVTVQKTNKRDKTHFYRDLLTKLSPNSLELLIEQNELELDFFEKAIQLHEQKMNEWKKETSWEF